MQSCTVYACGRAPAAINWLYHRTHDVNSVSAQLQTQLKFSADHVMHLDTASEPTSALLTCCKMKLSFADVRRYRLYDDAGYLGMCECHSVQRLQQSATAAGSGCNLPPTDAPLHTQHLPSTFHDVVGVVGIAASTAPQPLPPPPCLIAHHPGCCCPFKPHDAGNAAV